MWNLKTKQSHKQTTATKYKFIDKTDWWFPEAESGERRWEKWMKGVKTLKKNFRSVNRN